MNGRAKSGESTSAATKPSTDTLPVDYDYTLLIVESPTVATAVRKFQVPGIEVLASRGYAWIPRLSSDDKKLRAKANPDPETAAFRKKLKEKSRWAKTVIIATDPDPSGAFIGSCIRKYLKDHPDIRFTLIQDLSPDEIRFSLDHSTKEAPLSDNTLECYFTARSALQSHLKNRYKCGLIEFLAAAVFKSDYPTRYFQCPDGKIFTAHKPLQCAGNLKVKRLQQPEKLYKSPATPPSTADILGGCTGLYQQAQENLNMLFSAVPDELQTAPISYPRTSSRCYTESVFDRLRRRFSETDPDLIPVPDALIDFHNEKLPHQAVHVMDPHLTPADIRPFYPKRRFELYSKIWQYSRAAISADPQPCRYDFIGYYDQSSHFFMAPDNFPDDSVTLTPKITDADFMQALLETGWVRASGIGECMDRLTGLNIIMTENKNEPLGITFVKSGKDFPSLDEIPGQSFRNLQKLYSDVLNSDIPAEHNRRNIQQL